MLMAALYIERTVAGETPRLLGWVAVAVAVAGVAILAYARRSTQTLEARALQAVQSVQTSSFAAVAAGAIID